MANYIYFTLQFPYISTSDNSTCRNYYWLFTNICSSHSRRDSFEEVRHGQVTSFGQQNVSRNDDCHFQSKLLRVNVLSVTPFPLVTGTAAIPDGRSDVIPSLYVTTT